MVELEDYCHLHLQELFWKTTVTVITVIVRIGETIVIYKNSFGRPLSLSSLSLLELVRLLSFTRTLLEDHCHCHCQLQVLLC